MTPPYRDVMYPVQFCGAEAFAISWQGKELPMYLATEREARQLLWMLQHPEEAQAMLKAFMNSLHFDQPFVERFNSLRKRGMAAAAC